MKYEAEYLKLLDLHIRIVESIKGEKVTEEFAWLTETQPTATKLFYHLGTIYHLSKGTILPKLADIEIEFIDYSSILVLTRATLETYLAFNFIFVAPGNIEESKFRYNVWQLSGLLSRQKFPATEEINKSKKAVDKIIIDKLIVEIENSPFFLKYDRKKKEKILSGDWKLCYFWPDLAKFAGFDQNYFRVIYSFLCSYAHTSNLSVFQIAQADKDTHFDMAETWMGIDIVIMSYFIFDYCAIYPKARMVLDQFPETTCLARKWHKIGHEIK